jgi:glycosyltransferase involved in cell wall biosynthesis
LKETSFDLINFHHPLSALGVNLSIKAQKISKVYTFHSSWPEEYEIRTKKRGVGFLLRKWIERKVLSSCRNVIVLSEYSKREILKLHQALFLNIKIIPGGVDVDKFRPSEKKDAIRIKLGIPQDKFILLTVRDLTARMGLENLITAMTEITRKYKNILLIICGSGSLESKLKQLTKELGLEKYVKFTGIIEDDVLPHYYQAADIFVLPTKHLEGFGLVTLEALACGTPVLGTPVGATSKILKGLDEKFLFKDATANSMSKLIMEFIDKRINENSQIRKRCRQFVIENYSWEKTTSSLEKLFLELL